MQTPSNENINSSLFPFSRFDPPHQPDRVFNRGQDVDVARGEFRYQRFPGGRELALDFDGVRVRRFDLARGEI